MVGLGVTGTDLDPPEGVPPCAVATVEESDGEPLEDAVERVVFFFLL